MGLRGTSIPPVPLETTEGGADNIPVSEGAVVCECPWWEDAPVLFLGGAGAGC